MNDRKNPQSGDASLRESHGTADDTPAVTVTPTERDTKIPVKFNKETRLLDLSEAAALAQKGMKYDLISTDLERIKQLAASEGRSMGDYLSVLEARRNDTRLAELTEKCGGDKDFAEHILTLESNSESAFDGGFSELKAEFPEIEDISDLPEEVRQTADTRGSSLLDEYLRYLHRNARQAQNLQTAADAAIGSQRQSGAPQNPERTEFIKALWGK